MNRLHRDCFFFAATATLLVGCHAVITEPTERGTTIQKTVRADGSGGIVEDNKNLQLADPTRDGFHVIGEPQAKEIFGAEPSQSPHSKSKSQSKGTPDYHIKYGIVAALSPEPPSNSNAAPTQNGGFLRYRIWIPTGDSDNIGKWSSWTTSNISPDRDSKPSSLSGTALQPGKWTLTASTSASEVTIQGTGVDGKKYTWTGTWALGTAAPRGFITWSCIACP